MARFLTDPHSYPQRAARVRLFETHASWVAVLPGYVYKVKKPVNLGFLDFSTIEKRRHFCEREVALNRRLCSDIYLGVVPILKRKGDLTFDTPGRVVDYAIKMRRLPSRHFMLPLLRRGAIGRRQLEPIIATLRNFYNAHPSAPENARWGRLANIKKSTDENTLQTRPFLGETIHPAALTAICAYNTEFYRLHKSLFEARVREGCIRDCHGDLHLEHIHLHPRVTIYDCIEFNDRFRMIDVANDIAFLAMDLDFHGRPDLGRHFANRMAGEMQDPELPRLLNFYKCYRACVRGKVESLRSVTKGLPERERRGSRRLAERYFHLALKYAIRGSNPMVLIVMGRVASGKSTLATQLGNELGWEVFSSDRVRKEMAGVPLRVRGDGDQRKRLYSRLMSDRTYAALTRFAIRRIRCGHSVILDATFAGEERRHILRTKLAALPADYCFVEARASTPAIRRRLHARLGSKREISDARPEDFPALNRAYQPPKELDGQHFMAVRTNGARELPVTTVLKTLARRRAHLPESA